ncbi:MAG: sodium:solute symporter [Bacteroidales bacterium]|nr:sodium:solute symporter [Bacteroidales bacterium]
MNSTLMASIVFGYFAILLLLARITRGKNNDNESFFLGGRCSPWVIVAFGMIGSSLSGVSFISVPGWVMSTKMTYLQTVLGFFAGYIVVAKVLLPLYYRLHLTSIYSFLKERLGIYSYKSAASFFILSKSIGAAARLYIVTVILQNYLLDGWNIPYIVTVAGILLLIWAYTCQGGIKTIIWTDTFQTFCMLGALVLIIFCVAKHMHLTSSGVISTITGSPYFKVFEWDWHSQQFFVKQFLSGIFITIAMTGLDQDMMQKNLSCRSLKEAQKNMYWYGGAFLPVNFLFLSLGILLISLAQYQGIPLPHKGDDLLPMFAASGVLGDATLIFFTFGITAAAFSSADSALTALTTTFCIDILGIEKKNMHQAKQTRMLVHLCITLCFIAIILIFKALNNRSIIDAIYLIASYTYGPLIGLFGFGLFTKRFVYDKVTPFICIASPLLCYALDKFIVVNSGYKLGYEIILINGLITFIGLQMFSRKN